MLRKRSSISARRMRSSRSRFPGCRDLSFASYFSTHSHVPLEESFSLYHAGMEMLKACNGRLDKVEKKMLALDSEGEAYDSVLVSAFPSAASTYAYPPFSFLRGDRPFIFST